MLLLNHGRPRTTALRGGARLGVKRLRPPRTRQMERLNQLHWAAPRGQTGKLAACRYERHDPRPGAKALGYDGFDGLLPRTIF